MWKSLLSKALESAGTALKRDANARGVAVEVSRDVLGEVARTEEGAAGLSGAMLGASLGEAGRRLRDGDLDGALDVAASGAEPARRVWRGRGR